MGYFLFGAFMNSQRVILATLAAGLTAGIGLCQSNGQTGTQTGGQNQTATPSSAPEVVKAPSRADTYYNYTMGHIYEQQYEATSKPEYATQAIEAYKKAYALDPKSPVIGERLAGMYLEGQRNHAGGTEAQALLKRDPNDIQSRRLLGRIYLRSLGDFSVGNGQSEIVERAIEQYAEIYRLDPVGGESALWLGGLCLLGNR